MKTTIDHKNLAVLREIAGRVRQAFEAVRQAQQQQRADESELENLSRKLSPFDSGGIAPRTEQTIAKYITMKGHHTLLLQWVNAWQTREVQLLDALIAPLRQLADQISNVVDPRFDSALYACPWIVFLSPKTCLQAANEVLPLVEKFLASHSSE